MKINIVTAIFIVFLLTISNVFSQNKTQLWGGLKKGTYAVGHKVLFRYDHSRTWQSEDDYLGNKLPTEASRPIRISVWYPAKPNGSPMLFSQYFQTKPTDKNFAEFNKQVNDYAYQSVKGSFKSGQYFDSLQKQKTVSYLNAPEQTGKFPIIIHSLGQNNHVLENVVLWEFLASHGYIVATVPHLGTSPRRFSLLVHDQLFYEAQVRDLEFAIQELSRMQNVDSAKIGLIGYSMGGIYALLTTMRNSKVDAFIGLDPSFMDTPPPFYYKYSEAAYYDVARLKSPILILYKTPNQPNLEIINSFKYSDRLLLNFPQLTHGDFNSYPMMMQNVPPAEQGDQDSLKIRNSETGVLGHKTILNYALNFLNANLKNDKQSAQFLQSEQGVDGFIKREFKAGMKAPNEEEFYTIIKTDGLNKALEILRTMKAKYPNETIIRENVLRRIGNEAIFYGNPNLAIEIYKLNVEAHPNSASAYVKLAQTYAENGNKELAKTHFQKALAIDPNNKDAIEGLNALN